MPHGAREASALVSGPIMLWNQRCKWYMACIGECGREGTSIRIFRIFTSTFVVSLAKVCIYNLILREYSLQSIPFDVTVRILICQQRWSFQCSCHWTLLWTIWSQLTSLPPISLWSTLRNYLMDFCIIETCKWWKLLVLVGYIYVVIYPNVYECFVLISSCSNAYNFPGIQVWSVTNCTVLLATVLYW